jgi:hypothetical protein
MHTMQYNDGDICCIFFLFKSQKYGDLCFYQNLQNVASSTINNILLQFVEVVDFVKIFLLLVDNFFLVLVATDEVSLITKKIVCFYMNYF